MLSGDVSRVAGCGCVAGAHVGGSLNYEALWVRNDMVDSQNSGTSL